MVLFALSACSSPEAPPDTSAESADTAETADPGDPADLGPSDVTEEANGTLLINEFLAFAASSASDRSDWLEVYNAGEGERDLSRTRLQADDGDDQGPWTFPSGTTLAPGARVLVICDETNQGGDELHASFRIARQDGDLFLTDGATGESDHLRYTYQEAGVSSARRTDGDVEWVTDRSPTPGTPNG